MALRQKGDYWYGDGPADVWDYFVWWTRDALDKVAHRKQAVCSCGHRVFMLLLDEEHMVAERVCVECDAEHRMLDDAMLEDGEHPSIAVQEGRVGDDALDEETQPEEECDPEEFLCICGCDEFEIVGVTAPFPENPDSAKWFYLGVRCVECGCLGCCAEWLVRYNDHKELLALL